MALFHNLFMRFQKLPYIHSLRRQYLFLAMLLATVVLAYTWVAGHKVVSSGQTSTRNIAQRLQVSDLTHKIRRDIIASDDTLNLYLLSPSESSRVSFQSHLKKAQESLNTLLEISWVKEGRMFSMLQRLQPILTAITNSGDEVMTLRVNANLMYPAIRIANGQMLEDHNTFLSETGTAIQSLLEKRKKGLKKPEQLLLQHLYETRDMWQRMITAYRLYLVNRTASLHEDVLRTQSNDVEVLYNNLHDKVKSLTFQVARHDADLEVSTAIEQLSTVSVRWFDGYREVMRIGTEGQWRSDLSLMKDIIHPLLKQVYEKLDELEDELKKSADTDLVGQTELGDSVVYSLWGMALFVLCIAVISLMLLEFNFIRPIAGVARSLKAEAHGKATELPLESQAVEIRDLTDAFRELRQQVHSRQLALEHIAMHDSLTSLPNRALLMDRLNQAIENAQRRQRNLALLMLDLDRFKEINDTLGHQTGDALLQQVGARLRGVLRDSDTVARLGGDEFAILLVSVNESNALLIAAAIHEALEKVYEVYEHSLYVGVSLGIAIFPQHGETAETLLQHADVAMYMAKRTNNGITLYDTTRDQHSVSQLSVLSELRGATEREEFYLLYQPKLSMRTGTVTSVEALVRWRHPVHGVVMPDDFISTAEQTGLIKRLSPWLLDHALQDCRRLHQAGYPVSVSVNLSVWDIQDGSLASTLRTLLQKSGVKAEFLMLEITERVMMAEPERAREILKEIDAMGVKIAIDDFGTGFSSLMYLKQLPVDTLKIDKSFVMDMLKDESNSAIVHSIIELAHNLGLDVIAEGVENDQTWSWLKRWQCDFAQGYYISHPLSYEDLEKYLQTAAQNNIVV